MARQSLGSLVVSAADVSEAFVPELPVPEAEVSEADVSEEVLPEADVSEEAEVSEAREVPDTEESADSRVSDAADEDVVVRLVSELVADAADSAAETDASEAAASKTFVIFAESEVPADPGVMLHAISCRLNRTHIITPEILNIFRI